MAEPSLADEIRAHYETVDEAGRLDRAQSQIEKVRTHQLLERYLPTPPAALLDVGGGSGVYAFWLAERGYQVHLIDSVAKHLEQARAAAETMPGIQLASIKFGDARQLEHEDSSIDAILLLGPLYHLTERQDRVRALREAYRVLRDGGVMFAASINRYASLVGALLEGLLDDPDFAPIYERDIREGQHRNPTNNPDYFTTAFFHHPHELKEEVVDAGFNLIALLAVEGPFRIARNFPEIWQNPEMQERILGLARTLEAEPTLWGVSTHIMAVGKKG
jgi:ubiquinone/menaquinone biosynthesis C-methylase UbiE